MRIRHGWRRLRDQRCFDLRAEAHGWPAHVLHDFAELRHQRVCIADGRFGLVSFPSGGLPEPERRWFSWLPEPGDTDDFEVRLNEHELACGLGETQWYVRPNADG